jgi:chromosomal replication initiation ATPase DnaA
MSMLQAAKAANNIYLGVGLLISRPKINMTPELKVKLIKETVCDVYGVTFNQIDVHTRKRNCVIVRQMIMKVLYDKAQPLTLKNIGKLFPGHGGRFDHSTVIYARDAINGYIQVDSDIRAAYETIIEKLKEFEI